MIQSIHIENYRVIKQLDYDCKKGMNVIVGVNGAGKSTLLYALVVLLSWFRARVKNPKGRGLSLSDNDITYDEDFCLLKIVLSDKTEWQIYKQRSTNRVAPADKSDYTAMTKMINDLMTEYENTHHQLSLPIIAYYSVNRAVTNVPKRLHTWQSIAPLDAYSGNIEHQTNFRGFFEWYRTKEDIENQMIRETNNLAYRDRQLEAVRCALRDTLPEYGEIRVHRGPQYFYMEKDCIKYRFEQFSDGEKCYITLISDIARLLAMANPSLDNPLDGNGVVIVDEIDLHLHPSWQMKVIEDLRGLFPNCQFFISTHSPIVTSNVGLTIDDQLLVAIDGVIEPTDDRVFGKEVDMILLDQFDMKTTRNLKVQEYIDKVWSLLQEGDFQSEEFVKNINFLKEYLPNDDSEFARINLQIALLKKDTSR